MKDIVPLSKLSTPCYVSITLITIQFFILVFFIALVFHVTAMLDNVTTLTEQAIEYGEQELPYQQKFADSIYNTLDYFAAQNDALKNETFIHTKQIKKLQSHVKALKLCQK